MTAVTEQEAEWNWCPHLKVNGTDRHNYVFAFDKFTNAGCIGSRCMAWRWLHDNETASVRRGYCGLAGRP